ncbi:hypothetical protein B0H14DRAFT_3711968 [Mycena olivaceomarginata]|nr:hypothetical protein B0H14DRAFT_3711968 [Mycena olivaceomarginata]
MDDDTFKKTDWIGQGKVWAATLPSPVPWSLSIAKLIEFQLPVQIPTVSSCIVSEFFSKTSPGPITSEGLLRLRHLPIPDTKLVRKLGAEMRQAWLDGFQSVRYVHISGTVVSYFPLWLITFWNEVLDIKLNVRQYWMRGQAWMETQKKKKGHTSYRSLAEQTSILLGTLPWGLMKLSDGEEYHSSWRFLGPHWLNGSQLNDMLELLRLKINTTSELVKDIRIRTVDLTNSIVKAYEARGGLCGGTAYRLAADTGRRSRGQPGIVADRAHLGLINSEPHWTALVVDVSEGVIQY